jgi:hypothetical protein
MIDTIKGTITYVTAAVAILGSIWIAYMAWSSPVPDGGGRDIAILFGFLGLIVGGAVAFLFNSESATRATRAAQASASAQPTVTTTSGPPAETTVTPPPPIE